MFDRYDQVLGLAIWGPWVVVAGLAIALFFSIRSGMRWMKWSDIHKKNSEGLSELTGALRGKLDKAKAEARELKAALDENERKWMARWTAKFPPPRPTSLLSNPPTLGNPAKKGVLEGKMAPEKKVKVSVAKKKKRA